MSKERILTGDRPTGKLHLGHYVGSLANRVKLQAAYDTFIMVADVQALTDNYENPGKVRDNIIEVTLDNISVGLDPDQSTFFVQSMVPQIAELTVYLMNLVTLARVLRNPTVKSEMQQKGYGEDVPTGFAVYPISQAADILSVRADLVPVGEDQMPMIEQTREVARKFNRLYGDVFPEPVGKVGEVARLIGTDGNAKMSKSLGNTIYLSDPRDRVKQKVMSMYTDPQRLRATDPGKVEGNPVFIYLDAFGAESDRAQIADYKDRYTKGKVGDVEVKRYLVDVIERFLSPMRMRRAEYEHDPKKVEAILRQGTNRALEVAAATMKAVKQAMKIDYF